MQSSFQSLSVMIGWGRTVMTGFGTVSTSSAGGSRDSESETWHWHGAFVASSVLVGTLRHLCRGSFNFVPRQRRTAPRRAPPPPTQPFWRLDEESGAVARRALPQHRRR